MGLFCGGDFHAAKLGFEAASDLAPSPQALRAPDAWAPPRALSATCLPRRQIAITSASVTSWACHLSTHRPADRAPGEQIDDGSHMEPAFRCPHIGEVGDPFAVGSGRFEAAVEHVGSDGGDLPLTQIGAAVDAVADGL